MNKNYNQTSILSVQNILPVLSTQVLKNEFIIAIRSKNLLHALNIVKKHINYQYTLLTCVSGLDLLHTTHRFAVVYDLLSIKYNSRIRFKVFLNESTIVKSCISVYVNANWWEREVWDMFGIYFQNHPDLRRILTDYGFEGYPLRKDFPPSGFVEVRYDSNKKRVALENIELAQEFRSFQYELSC